MTHIYFFTLHLKLVDQQTWMFCNSKVLIKKKKKKTVDDTVVQMNVFAY